MQYTEGDRQDIHHLKLTTKTPHSQMILRYI